MQGISIDQRAQSSVNGDQARRHHGEEAVGRGRHDGGGVQGVAEAVRRRQRRPHQPGGAPAGHQQHQHPLQRLEERPGHPVRRRRRRRLHRRRRGRQPGGVRSDLVGPQNCFLIYRLIHN